MRLNEMNPIGTSASNSTGGTSSSYYEILAQVTLIQSDNARSPKNPVSAIAAERLRNEQMLTQGKALSQDAEKLDVDNEKRRYRRRLFPREITTTTTTTTTTTSRRRKTAARSIRSESEPKSMMNGSSSTTIVDQRLQSYMYEGNNNSSIQRMMVDAEYIREQCLINNKNNNRTYISVQMGTCQVRKQDRPPEKPRRRLSMQK